MPDWESAQIILVLALVVLVLVGFVRERLPPDVVAMAAMAILLATGILDAREVLAVFSNPGPITVACMFVLSAALERTGLIEAVGANASRMAATSPARALAALTVSTMLLSAFINNTPVVAILTPVTIMLARALKVAPSRLLIPLSYASIFGGTTTLIGTSTNLLVNGVGVAQGQPAFGMFEITAAGVLLGAVGIGYMLVFGRWLLPDRETFAGMTAERSRRAFVAELLIPYESPLVGKTLGEANLTAGDAAEVIDLIRNDFSTRRPNPETVLQAGDRVVLRTQLAEVISLREAGKVVLGTQDPHAVEPVSGRRTAVMEGIVGPQSRLIGYRIADLNFRRLYGVYILAVHRQGEDLLRDFGETTLSFGDVLLLEGPADGLRRLFERRVLVNLEEPSERPFRRDKAPIALGAILLVMLLAALEVMPIEALALIAAVTVVALGCVTAEEAYSAIQWRIIMLIFGMLALGTAMEKTGAAALIVQQMAGLVGAWGPVAVLAALYLIASVLTEIISNNAAAILLTPVAIGLAHQMGLDPRPFMVAVLFAASASFATPIGYQTNTFVYSAGGYRFTDFLRVGLPLNLLIWAVAVTIIPIFWPLRPLG